VNRAVPEPDRGQESVLAALAAGKMSALEWLLERCRRHAAPRFSAWAWEWIEEDFVADLRSQLLQTSSRPAFALRGPEEPYVVRAIHNLCCTYFRRVAAVRRQDPLSADADLPGRDPEHRIAAALDLRRGLLVVGPECRRRLVDKYVMGLSLQEMARAESVSAQTLRSRLHACRERLREFWARQVEK